MIDLFAVLPVLITHLFILQTIDIPLENCARKYTQCSLNCVLEYKLKLLHIFFIVYRCRKLLHLPHLTSWVNINLFLLLNT